MVRHRLTLKWDYRAAAAHLVENHRMHIASIGIDLGKTTFHLVAHDEHGKPALELTNKQTAQSASLFGAAITSLAGIVSAAKIAAQKHFSSDVVAGGTMGWFIGRYVYETHMSHLAHKHSSR